MRLFLYLKMDKKNKANNVYQLVDNLFYNTNQSRKVAIAIKQLFDLSMFDGSYGIDYLQAVCMECTLLVFELYAIGIYFFSQSNGHKPHQGLLLDEFQLQNAMQSLLEYYHLYRNALE
jgi:hypothetical protein